MLARIRKSQETEGFTLIELLVVMIIIGILAAIAIPVFLNQRKKAQDSAAKADVSTLGKEVATYYVDNTGAPVINTTAVPGRYTLVGTTNQDLGKVSANVTLNAVVSGATFVDSTHWCIAVTNTQGSQQTYKYSASGGLNEGVCAAADVA